MNDRRKGALLIAAAALLWSTGGIGIKAIDDPPLKVTFYRSVFAGITLFVLFGPKVWATRRWSSTAAFVVAIISYGACLVSFVVATKWTTAANAIFLQYAGAIWVLLLSPLVLREPMRVPDVVAIGVALGGMILFFIGRFETRGMSGNAMALVSSFFFASMILALRRERVAANAAIVWGNVVLALALLPAVYPSFALTRRSAIVLVLLGVFQIAAPYALFVRGLRYVSATQASLTGMIEPVANPIWVFLFLGERPAGPSILGGAIVLGAIAWHTWVATPAVEMPAPD